MTKITALMLIMLICTGQFGCKRENYSIDKSFPHALGSVRYRDNFFTQVDTSYFNFIYKVAKTYHNTETTLKMDIYQPSGDTAQLRPVLMYVHGGAFTGYSEKSLTSRQICDSFARRGYVTISIGYRLGIDWKLGMSITDSATKQFETIYRGTQDIRTAVKYIKSYYSAGRIDTTKMFLSGGSAGSVLAINVGYLDQFELPAAFTAQNGLLDEPGTYSYPGYSSKVSGIINMEGEIFDTAWMATANPPIISLYGTADQLYNFFDVDYVSPHVPFFGGQSIQRRATNLGLPCAIQTYPGGVHGSVTDVQNIASTIIFISNAMYSQL